VADLAGNAHLEREVVAADQERIDALDAGNGVGILNSQRRLDHGDDQELGIERPLCLRRRRRPIAEAGVGPTGAAMSQRTETKGLNQAPRRVRRVDVRHDDAEGAVVERARALIKCIRTDAHDRHHPHGRGRHGDLGDFRRGNGAVLGVDEQPVVTGGLGKQRHRRAAQMMHAKPKREFTIADPLQGIAGVKRHRRSFKV
jgi:hypothetical protein